MQFPTPIIPKLRSAHDMLRVHAGAIPERTQCTRGAIYYPELTYSPLEQQAEKDSSKTRNAQKVDDLTRVSECQARSFWLMHNVSIPTDSYTKACVNVIPRFNLEVKL